MSATNFRIRYGKLLESISLNRLSKDIIKERYLPMVTSAESDYTKTRLLYIILTNIITIAGVLITAFVSFDKLSLVNNSTTQAFLWVVWCLGIILTLANKWLYVFGIPKRYILNIVVLEKLYSEGWSFLSITGKYKNITEPEMRFKLFCSRVEKIKMKSLEVIPEMESADAINEILAAGPQQKIIADTVNFDEVIIMPPVDDEQDKST